MSPPSSNPCGPPLHMQAYRPKDTLHREKRYNLYNLYVCDLVPEPVGTHIRGTTDPGDRYRQCLKSVFRKVLGGRINNSPSSAAHE